MKGLKHRKFFNFVYLDTPMLMRYKNFKSKYKSLFQEENIPLNLENFVILDDFITYKTSLKTVIEGA